MANDTHGNVYFTEPGAGWRIRCVRPDGILTTVAGTGTFGFSGDGGPATAAKIKPNDIAVGPDGSIYFADDLNHRVRRVFAPLPGFTGDEIAIPSEDGGKLFRFDFTGRHLDTRDAFTGAVLFTFAYNAGGQLVKITDGEGNATTIQRAANGAPLAIVAPFGQTTTLTADASGSLASVRDPLGGTFSLGSTADGLLLSDVDPVGNLTLFTYDPNGLLKRGDFAGPPADDLARADLPEGHFVTVTTALGVEEKYQVETLATGDELRMNTDAADFISTARRRANGMNTFTEPNGIERNVTLGPDKRFAMQAPIESSRTLATPGGKLLTLQTAQNITLSEPGNPGSSLVAFSETFAVNGKTFTEVYAPATKTFTHTTPLGRVQTRQINAQGRTTRRQFADLNARTFTYDGRGHLTTIAAGTGAATRTTKASYDTKGLPATLTNPLNEITRFVFDAAGRFTKGTAADGGVLTVERDAAGRANAVTPPGRAAHLLSYDPSGKLASYTAPGAAATMRTYNADGLLAQIARPGGATVDYGYDAADRLSTRTIAAGATTFAYSATTGNLSTITMPGGNALTLTFDGSIPTDSTWSGTVAGSVTRTLDNNLRTASQSVNGANPLAFSYDNDGLLTGAGALTLTRDPQRGFVTATTLGSVTDTRVRDAFGELTSTIAKFGATTIFSQQHTRDKLGRVVQTIESVEGGASVTTDYDYDAAGRLIDVSGSGPHPAFTYDANGNRLTAAGVVATYDGQDRVTSLGTTTFSHTDNGDLLTKTAAGQPTTYTYDALGNLTAVALPGGMQIGYVLDGRNRRIGKRVNGTLTRGFLYENQLRIVAELDGSNAVVSRFVYGDRANVPAYMVTATGTFRLICDANGSVRLVVNTSGGAVAQRLDYDAFGNVLADSAPGFQPFGFAGGLYDPDTKLVRFGRRDYDAATGRWTARDPILFGGGDANLYAYAGNDPINRRDVTGTQPYDDDDDNIVTSNDPLLKPSEEDQRRSEQRTLKYRRLAEQRNLEDDAFQEIDSQYRQRLRDRVDAQNQIQSLQQQIRQLQQVGSGP